MNKLKTLTLAVAAVSAASASAFEFDAGPVSGQINTSVSWGIGVRTEDQDLTQVHKDNAAGGTGSSYNFDDGTLNYENGDVITNVLKGNMDLELVMGDGGAFFRGTAFYDAAIMDDDPAFKDHIDATKDAAGSGYDLLDAFVWYNFDMGDIPVSARLGRQVLSWGESTFILGGISSINPINASAVRKPGVEVKEVLLPVNMAYGSFGLTDDVTLEAFYQLEWEKTRPDACGTFFSTTDFVSDGCGPVLLGGAEDERDILARYESGDISTTAVTPRLDDVTPSDDGQFGLALRWYSEELGDTEFGFYYMNVHSRLPVIGGVVANPAAGNNFPSYRIEYPEDIKISGLSFSRGTESGWSIGGELSYKQDAPVQWNSFEILLGGLLNADSLLLQDRAQPLVDSGAAADLDAAIASLAGNSFTGYDFYDIAQAQLTAIKFIDQIAGASRLTFISEVGMVYVPDLPGLDEARYGRSGAYGMGTVPDATVGTGDRCTDPTAGTTVNNTASNCTNDGYVDDISYGVRLRASLEYPNLFAGINVNPQVSLGLDEGTSPGPGGAFEDGRIKAGLAVNFEYLNRYTGGIAYTYYDGSKYDMLKDRDNVSMNIKATF